MFKVLEQETNQSTVIIIIIIVIIIIIIIIIVIIIIIIIIILSVTWGHTTRVIFRAKKKIFERSNEKKHFAKTELFLHQKITPQSLEHIGLQNMKVGMKLNFVWLAAVCLVHVDISS